MKTAKLFRKKKNKEITDISDTTLLAEETPTSNEKINDTKPSISKRKNNNKILRICVVCMNPFRTSRKDAMYCRGRCRQYASHNGLDYGKSIDFPQYLLINELKDRFEDLIEKQGTDFYLYELDKWMDHSWKVKELLFPHVDYKNHHRIIYLDVLDPLYDFIEKKYSGFQNNPFRYQIPMGYINAMYEYLDSLPE